ncbi:ankyrin repeat domain-containing protein [Singulisphaera rosea]
MDFGGFVLWLLLALGLLGGSLFVVAVFIKRSSKRWPQFGLWLVGLMMLAVFGRHLYQVYWLDERLLVAAAKGDLAQVQTLLSAGASPSATWEDGISALSLAHTRGHKDVVLVLERADEIR